VVEQACGRGRRREERRGGGGGREGSRDKAWVGDGSEGCDTLATVRTRGGQNWSTLGSRDGCHPC
jgi:hypothetical protein